MTSTCLPSCRTSFRPSLPSSLRFNPLAVNILYSSTQASLRVRRSDLGGGAQIGLRLLRRCAPRNNATLSLTSRRLDLRFRGERGRGGDPVGAAARSGDQVVLAFDVPAGSEKVPKDLQFDAAEALAAQCCGADWAVIFNKQKAFIGKLFEPRHVAFGGAHVGQCRQLSCDIGLADEPPPVRGGDLLPAVLQEPRQGGLAEFAADRADQINSELGMGVGK